MLDVKRSMPAPASLEREVSYTDLDVLEALHADFGGKCYLCERKIVPGGFQVDHRRPKAEWPQGRYEWTNLFPACGYCNGRRPKRYPDGGLISPGDGVERRVQQVASVDDRLCFECIFTATKQTDGAVCNTAEELERIHSVETATTPGARLNARSFLDSIDDYFIGVVKPLQRKVLRARERGEADRDAEGQLRNALSRRAPFAMLMRSLVDRRLVDLFD